MDATASGSPDCGAGPNVYLSPATLSELSRSNPSIVSQIVKNTSTINLVAAQVGVQPGKLRRGTASSAVANGGTSAKNAQTALVTITVRGPWKRPAADAAKQQLDALDSAISQYQSAATNQSLTPAERLAAVGLLNAAVAQRGDLVAAKTQTDLQLELAKNVEKGQVVTRAAASQISARSRRSSTIVGAAIGLLLGIAVALLWEPVRRRARRSRADGQPAT